LSSSNILICSSLKDEFLNFLFTAEDKSEEIPSADLRDFTKDDDEAESDSDDANYDVNDDGTLHSSLDNKAFRIGSK
jgi:hypothetical protein